MISAKLNVINGQVRAVSSFLTLLFFGLVGLSLSLNSAIAQTPPYELEDLALLNERSQAGDVSAQEALVEVLLYGFLDDDEVPESFRDFAKMSSMLGNGLGEFSLGVAHQLGVDGEKDLNKAIEHFDNAAVMEFVPALYRLGRLLYEGEEVTQDKISGEVLIRDAALRGHSEAQYFMGLKTANFDLDHEANGRAIDWLRMAAENQNAEAMFALGRAHHFGNGVQRDQFEMTKWYRRGAENGNAEAQLILGMFHETGEYLSKDIDQARFWYGRASANGNAIARTRLTELNDPSASSEKKGSALNAASSWWGNTMMEQVLEPLVAQYSTIGIFYAVFFIVGALVVVFSMIKYLVLAPIRFLTRSSRKPAE